MPSQLDLDAIRARAEAASVGPWETELVSYPGHPEKGASWMVDSEPTFICSTHVESDRGKNDAHFIAHARTDVPALLAEVDRLTTERDRFNTIIEQVRELHRPVEGFYSHHSERCDECEVPYPCPTITALGGVS